MLKSLTSKVVLAASVATVTISAAAPAAKAAIFTVGNQKYDISTVTGSYNDNADLQSQVWWNNAALATTFAQTVQSSLGLGANRLGPLFAVKFEDDFGVLSKVWSGDKGTVVSSLIDADDSVTYAIATAVPTPALLPGLIGIGIAAVRKRKHKTGEPMEA